MTNKVKTGISKNWLRKTLKSFLPKGTHVAPEVYDHMATYMDKELTLMIKNIVEVWERNKKTNRVKVMPSDVKVAIYEMRYEGDGNNDML